MVAVAAPDCDSKNLELLSQPLAQSQVETTLRRYSLGPQKIAIQKDSEAEISK